LFSSNVCSLHHFFYRKSGNRQPATGLPHAFLLLWIVSSYIHKFLVDSVKAAAGQTSAPKFHIPISLSVFLPIVAPHSFLGPAPSSPSLVTVPPTEVDDGVEEEHAPETPWDGREGHARACCRVSTGWPLPHCPWLQLAGPCRHAHELMCCVAARSTRPAAIQLDMRRRFD
jgi:hypothetical protein